MRVAILQSNYIPWKGYFDLIGSVDEFILYDDAQYTKNDWRNRNRIRTPQGSAWLTVPVGQGIHRRIRDVVLPDARWQARHWRTLEANYRRAPCFDEVAQALAGYWLARRHASLSELNRALLSAVCGLLSIR
ncbi:MAG TPA: WbqC family protein, partial [Luteimonas sp.]|nr:WbqC family protein [Luteimonas sp.]